MNYEHDYKNRTNAKKHLTKVYSQEELNDIAILIKKYYEIEHPTELINTNEAYFISLAGAINESQFKGKEVIKAKYLCEIYNGLSNSKKKNIEKMLSIKEFLNSWLILHQKQNKDQLEERVNGTIADWIAAPHTSTPQWADYIALPLKNGIIKRLICDVFTKSNYYRFGFKFIRSDGRLFGDGSIQSQDNNFVIHIGKNFTDKELFITVYRNGILSDRDKYTDIIPKNNFYKCELYIDAENFIHFFINGAAVYKNFINKEICSRVYMLAWGDGNKFEVKVKNIKIEIERT